MGTQVRSMLSIATPVAAIAVVVAVLAAGCGGNEGSADDDTSASVEPSATQSESTAPEAGPGTFRYEDAGVKVTLVVPTPVDDPRVADVEAYRKSVDAPALQYIHVEVDNSGGSEEVWTNRVQVVTEDKRQVEVAALGETDGGVLESETWPEDSSSRNVDLTNANGGIVVKPGAVATTIMATFEDISTPTRVFVPLEDYGDELPTVRVDVSDPSDSTGEPGVSASSAASADPAGGLEPQEVADTLGCKLSGDPQPNAETEYECGQYYIVDFENSPNTTEEEILNELAWVWMESNTKWENFAYLGDLILLLGPSQPVEDAIKKFPGAH